ncbi:hypothetical protein XfCFBP8082_06530, partial [Xylella fastidiosa subsp. fastidiosa]
MTALQPCQQRFDRAGGRATHSYLCHRLLALPNPIPPDSARLSDFSDIHIRQIPPFRLHLLPLSPLIKCDKNHQLTQHPPTPNDSGCPLPKGNLMNKDLYRLIYNRALRLWQVASELATASGGTPGPSPTAQRPARACLHPIPFALWLSLG